MTKLRRSICAPIPQIYEAARLLDAAVCAHLKENRKLADECIRQANMPVLHDWLKQIWLNCSVHVRVEKSQLKPSLARELRTKVRMPTKSEKYLIHERDGHCCRFCGIPVIRSEIRKRMQMIYPEAITWSTDDALKHCGFMVMWAQYDHVLPHAKGGTNDLQNLLLTCPACNFGRGGYTLDDVAVEDPRERTISVSSWDGLERFI